MSRKKMTKAQSMRWHTKWKINERYGIFCNGDLYRYIVNKIASGESECLLVQSNTRSIHVVYIPVVHCQDERTHIKVDIADECVKLYVVYDRSRQELCTALPWFATDEELLDDYYKNHEYKRD